MRITETFMSIQGEGPETGRPTFFIRTAGCNLDCSWCDTPHAREGGVEISVSRLLDAYLASCQAGGPGFRAGVCVTGGEPMIQSETIDLITALLDAGASVELMTNGSVSLASLPAAVRITIDLKTALMSGSPDRPGYPAPDFITCGRPGRRDCVKFVIASSHDFAVASQWATRNGLFDLVRDVRVSPAWGIMDPATLAGWIMAIQPRFVLGIQQHKYIWGPETRM